MFGIIQLHVNICQRLCQRKTCLRILHLIRWGFHVSNIIIVIGTRIHLKCSCFHWQKWYWIHCLRCCIHLGIGWWDIQFIVYDAAFILVLGVGISNLPSTMLHPPWSWVMAYTDFIVFDATSILVLGDGLYTKSDMSNAAKLTHISLDEMTTICGR